MVNRKPNIECAQCKKPIYRRPEKTIAAKHPPCCSTRCANLLRGCSHLHTQENRAKSAAKMQGENNPAWRGGQYIEPDKGYVMIRQPKHARARANGYVLEHILVAEKMLGRALLPGEEIHHKNGILIDNRPENLEVFPSHSAHWGLHLPLVPKKDQGTCKCGRDGEITGMCGRCYAYLRRTGRHRPATKADLRKGLAADF